MLASEALERKRLELTIVVWMAFRHGKAHARSITLKGAQQSRMLALAHGFSAWSEMLAQRRHLRTMSARGLFSFVRLRLTAGFESWMDTVVRGFQGRDAARKADTALYQRQRAGEPNV